jgi:hypothetical protein
MTQTTPFPTRLNGRSLTFARLTWVLIALLSGITFSIGLVVRYSEFQRVCDQPVAACNVQQILTPENAQAFANQSVSLALYALFQISKALLYAIVWCGVALIIFISLSDDWLALIVALFLILNGTQGGFWQAAAQLYPFTTPLAHMLTSLSWITFALFFALFPNGRFAPRWMRWVVIVWTFLWILPTRLADLIPEAAGGILFTSFFACMLYAQIYRYKQVSTPVERLQTKWVIYGVVIAIMNVFIFYLVSQFIRPLTIPGSPRYLIIQFLASFLLIFIPLSIGVAVLRSHLWDIDVIIRRTLVYGALTLALGLVYFGSVLVLQNLFQALTGHSQSPIVIVISTLAIAALFNPLRKRIQNEIDRRFYRRKFNAEQTLEAFAASLRQEVNLDEISCSLLAVATESMQPERVNLWLKADAGKISKQTQNL